MKRVLLISYYFSPCQAIGSKRWSEFFTLFDNDEEFEITVLTANWKGEKLDKKNVVYLGDEITFNPFKSINREFTLIDTLKHPSLYFRSLDRNMLDTQWYNLTKEWIEYNQEKSFDIVISSYTPINCIRLGSYAKKKFHSQYVVDMRDMMSIQGQKIRLPLINFIDNLIDKYWLHNADKIISVGPSICEKASRFYKKNVHLIYNAFLEKDYSSKLIESREKEYKKIVFSYLGTMGIRRNPRGLLKIANEYCKKNKDIGIEMNFASQDDPNEFIKDLDIKDLRINWLGYINKEEVEKLKYNTDCFILLEDIDEKGKENVTGKVFEYMLEQKPVLTYCHPNSDIKKILESSNIGEIVIDENGFNDFLSKVKENKFSFIKDNILQFSRENQYKKLKGFLLACQKKE